MYELIDIIKNAEYSAERIALNDRLKYSDFIEAGEHYAASNGLIISGESATRLLLGNLENSELPPNIGLDSFQYDFFSGHVQHQARELSDIMYKLDPQGLGHYTTVLTKIAGHVLSIIVDSRELFTLTALPKIQGVRTLDIIIPSYRPAQFAKAADGTPLKLLCVGPEIQLIRIYSMLTNPAYVSRWSELLTTEASLRQLLNTELLSKIKTVSVSGSSSVENSAEPETSTEPEFSAESENSDDVTETLGGGNNTNQASRKFYYMLHNKYAAGAGRVLIGPAAIFLLTGQNNYYEGRLQVITSTDLNSDIQEIKTLAKAINAEISWKISDPIVLTDRRIRRMIVYHVVNNNREPIIDIYNSAIFDIIPYITLSTHIKNHPNIRSKSQISQFPGSLKIGTPFILMRYRLIDMWTIQSLIHMGIITSSYAKSMLTGILIGYNTIAKFYELLITSTHINPEQVANQIIPLTSYIGNLESQDLAIKRQSQLRPEMHFYPPFLPASKN